MGSEKSMQEGANQPRQQDTLSPADIKLLSARFGHSQTYPNSVVGLTSEQMRQLAEHFTP